MCCRRGRVQRSAFNVQRWKREREKSGGKRSTFNGKRGTLFLFNIERRTGNPEHGTQNVEP